MDNHHGHEHEPLFAIAKVIVPMPAHETVDEETKGLLEFYPEHPPRKDTPEYRATHKLLTHTLDQPCRDCGVRLSTLADPIQNPLGAKQLETHHWPLQREFADALDPLKVNKEFPTVTDRKSLDMFIDSPANMLVLCLLPDTKVLMADGRQKKIIDVRVGDNVIGHDLLAHEVTAVMNREVSEKLYEINGVKMTGNHPVLTDVGFVEAQSLEVGQVVYKVGVFFKYMLGLRSIKNKVINAVIRPDSILMMNTFAFTSGGTAIAGAGAIPESQRNSYLKLSSTYRALLDGIYDVYSFLFQAGWIAINDINTFNYAGKVYDIKVEGSRSFIANGIAVHNCDVDHRSPTRGIHHINDSIEACKRFLLTGYIIADKAMNKEKDLAIDEALTKGETDEI